MTKVFLRHQNNSLFLIIYSLELLVNNTATSVSTEYKSELSDNDISFGNLLTPSHASTQLLEGLATRSMI